MIKFYCRRCGKELWKGAFKSMVLGHRWGEVIDELWHQLFCADCFQKGLARENL